MDNRLTLLSLFDGSGGFCLGALLSGIQPVGASEIEPFAIRVTTKRLPFMKHYGDVTALSGVELPPVDIITFGSPCQDMSIAGKREGLGGSRSNLFFEAVRIVKEMRNATDGKYPTWLCWENVPGAFSSNGGGDFKAVLDALRGIKDPEADTPRPQKWTNAGLIMADDYSIAWRVLNAQHFGVPQRRKRIYLVCDLAGQRAGKVLFESEGVSGYTPQGFLSWQGAAGASEEGSGEAGGVIVLNDQGGSFMNVSEDVTGTLRAQMDGHPPTVLEAIAIENYPIDSRAKLSEDNSVQTLTSRMGTGGNNVPLVMKIRCGCEGGGKGALIQKDKSATLGCNNDQTVFVPTAFGVCSKDSNAMKSDNPKSGFYEADSSRTLDGNGGNPTCNQGGIAVVAFADKHAPLSANDGPKGPSSQMLSSPEDNFVCEAVAIEGNGARPSHQGKGYSDEKVSFTLNATEQHAVAYGIDRATYNMGQNARFGITVETEVEPTMVAKDPGAVAHPVYSTSKNSYHTVAETDLVNTLVATDFKDPPTVSEDPYYVVRRLTPTECARLQGFPDWWCMGLETDAPTEKDLCFWREVFETYRKAAAPETKPKTDAQIIKWLKDPYSDSAEYKLWGNGVALPCVHFVLAGIAYFASLE
ncbi:MAG: DNA cytosine methyltransferase [Clostridia bacterium]|nr:DNA cytosine methyltransferase [Clostridia bacterium]